MVPITRRERRLLGALGAVVATIAIAVAGIQIFGAEMGAPCADSHSCRGFLVGGAECVDVEDGAYCTVYCRADARCPRGWRCLDANPTVLDP
jgi:hypothetical protein